MKKFQIVFKKKMSRFLRKKMQPRIEKEQNTATGL